MKIRRKSIHSGIYRVQEIDVEQWQIDHWKAGELLQNAFPNLSTDEREFIKTGITPSEWDEINGSE